MDCKKLLFLLLLSSCVAGHLYCSQVGEQLVEPAHELQQVQLDEQTIPAMLPGAAQEAQPVEHVPLYRKAAYAFKRGVDFCRQYPVTTGLMATNIGVFALQKSLSPKASNDFVQLFIRSDDKIKKWQLWRLFTSMFLHRDFDHLLKNLLAFVDVGYLEHRLGSSKFLGCYVTSGALGGVASFLLDAYYKCNRSCLGASGGLVGLQGIAASQGFGDLRLLKKWFLRRCPTISYGEFGDMVKPWALSMFWGPELYSVSRNISRGTWDGVGHATHIGGFASGLVLGRVFSD